MRLEASMNDVRGQQFEELRKELGLSKSELVEEAVAYLLDSIDHVKRGRAVAVMEDDRKITDLNPPTFSLIRWLNHRETVTLPGSDFDRVADALEKPAEPTEDLKQLMHRHRTKAERARR